MKNAQTIGPMNSGNQRRVERRIIELLTAALLCLCFNSINSRQKDKEIGALPQYAAIFDHAPRFVRRKA